MNWTRLIAASLITFSACGQMALADTLGDIQARKKLIVAIDLGLPPYGTVDASMKPTGSDVAAAQLLASELGVELDIVPATGANRIPFLQTGKVDIVMSSFSVTEERKKVIDFSIPYGMISIICAAPEATPIASARDLEGKTVAVTRGTGADMDATKMVKADPKISIVRFDDDATLITAVASGQENIIISAPAQMGDINQKLPANPLVTKFVVRTNGYAVGLRKGDDALKARINAWIAKDLANGKLRSAYRQFHGTDLPEVMPAN